MSIEDDDVDHTSFASHLRTVIILAARKCPTSDIDIPAVDQIVEATVDFVKNVLEQMTMDNQASTLTAEHLLNTLRVRPALFASRSRWLCSSRFLSHSSTHSSFPIENCSSP